LHLLNHRSSRNIEVKQTSKEQRIIDLISTGLSSDVAEKAIVKCYTLESLRSTPKTVLSKDFESWEVSSIIESKKRKPVATCIVTKLVNDSDWKCCMCWDSSKEQPVVIHHIIEHAKTGNDNYSNLVLLCLHHHELAHSIWKISRHPLPPALLRKTKRDFIREIARFKKGKRPPLTEETKTGVFGQSDRETLQLLRSFIDRPAMHQPFDIEGNMHGFLTAINDVIRALNTGILKTREGDEIARVKPRNMLSNPDWMEKLSLLTKRFEDLRTRFEVAVRNNEIHISSNGFYCFNNRNLPLEIDAIRESITLLFNELLIEAKLPTIASVRDYYSRWRGQSLFYR
jgi:hypothetical protein